MSDNKEPTRTAAFRAEMQRRKREAQGLQNTPEQGLTADLLSEYMKKINAEIAKTKDCVISQMSLLGNATKMANIDKAFDELLENVKNILTEKDIER